MMNRLIVVFSIIYAISGIADLPAQSGTKASVLKPLVGEKCTVYLNNGEEVSGTFWDYSTDAITVKVKKGLLYSKAEQVSVSEIKRFEGADGKTYDLQALLGTNPDVAKKAAAQKSADDIENVLRILTIKDDSAEEQMEVETAEKTPEQQSKPKLTPPSTSPAVAKSTTVEEKKDETPKQAVATKPVKPVRKSPAPKANKKRDTKSLSQVPENSKKHIPELPPEDDIRAAETLRYQTLVLAVAAGVMVILFIVFKGFGLNSLILAKYSMFPTRMIRMNGPYGIIDQGKEDGVKMDDIVRLYRKNEGKIEYNGKVRVTKVAQNYSAVEILRTKKDIKLGAGDVGVRDRNILLYSLKQVRTAVSAVLGALARMLAVTAKTLSVDHEDPLMERRPRIVKADHETDIKEVTELIKKSKPAENGEEATHPSDVSSEHIKR